MEKTPKFYVQVVTLFDLEGRMIPKVIVLEDGQRFAIDSVLDIKPAHARKAGGYGERYTVRIRGQERYLFFEQNTNSEASAPGKWFVERP